MVRPRQARCAVRAGTGCPSRRPVDDRGGGRRKGWEAPWAGRNRSPTRLRPVDHPEPVTAATADGLLPALADLLARTARRTLEAGVLHGHRETEEELPLLRGRIHTTAQLRRTGQSVIPTACTAPRRVHPDAMTFHPSGADDGPPPGAMVGRHADTGRDGRAAGQEGGRRVVTRRVRIPTSRRWGRSGPHAGVGSIRIESTIRTLVRARPGDGACRAVPGAIG